MSIRITSGWADSAPASASLPLLASATTYLSPQIARALFQAPSARALLSDRERQILAFLAQGQSSKHIANQLDLSVRTVESHRQNIRRKLNLAGQAELIKYAVEHPGGG